MSRTPESGEQDTLRVGYVTERAEAYDGWGRYTVGLVRAVKRLGIEPVLITAVREVDPSLGAIEQHVVLPRPLSKRFGTVRSLTAVRRLKPILATCDVVHNIVELYAPLVAVSCPRAAPFVQTAHGTWAVHPLRSGFRRRLFLAALRRVDLMVFQSRFTRDRMAGAVHLPRHEVWPAGVDPATARDTVDAALPDWARGGPVVLSVGVLREAKGHHLALEAVGQVSRSVPGVHLVIVGDGKGTPYARALEQRAAGLRMADRFHLMGRVSQAELAAWYRRADVFMLLPVNSGGTFEGLGLVYLEAAAAGKASIGTTGCGAAEAVIHEVTGLLVPQGDPAAAGNALARLLSDDGLLTKMGAAALQHAGRFSWDRLATRLKKAYQELTDARGRVVA
jgi:phosphatidylinositol alpha-1,6-mannosyltransferase